MDWFLLASVLTSRSAMEDEPIRESNPGPPLYFAIASMLKRYYTTKPIALDMPVWNPHQTPHWIMEKQSKKHILLN